MPSLPAFRLPAPVARLGAWLPPLPPTLLLTTALNLAPQRILPRDTLRPLTDKRLVVRVVDAGLQLTFTLGPRGFRPLESTAQADLTISASFRDFLALALREEDPDTLFFSRRLRMEGDTDLGLLVKNTLDSADWPGLIQSIPLLRRLQPPPHHGPA